MEVGHVCMWYNGLSLLRWVQCCLIKEDDRDMVSQQKVKESFQVQTTRKEGRKEGKREGLFLVDFLCCVSRFKGRFRKIEFLSYFKLTSF